MPAGTDRRTEPPRAAPSFSWLRLLGLVGLGLLAATLWRVELDLHGWEGLGWVEYLHLAIPLSAALFLGWLGFQSQVRPVARRIAYLGTTALLLLGAYVVTRHSLLWAVGAIQVWLPFEQWTLAQKMWLFSIYGVLPATPLLFFGVSRAFGQRFVPWALGLGLLIYLAAAPLAIGLLEIIPQPGGADFIHAIKTGFCVPFLVTGLGFPFLVAPRPAPRAPVAGLPDPPHR